MPGSISGAASLEAQLEICQEAARKAIARGEAIDPALDDYGHAASAAHSEALRYLRMSAKIGLALAKLKGEHTSNIRIQKTETVKPAPSVERPLGRLAAPSPDKFQAAWAKFTRETFGWDWGTDEAEEQVRGEGDPLSISEGSNASSG